jgi:hypothetical protein
MHFCCRINMKSQKEYDENGERLERHQIRLNYDEKFEQEYH